jgi:hypothetical protein
MKLSAATRRSDGGEACDNQLQLGRGSRIIGTLARAGESL